MPVFIKDADFLEKLKNELLDQIFHEKNNDLYKFQQVKVNFKPVTLKYVQRTL